MNPTQATYSELQKAFDHFNLNLFDNALPQCLITLQREKKSYGYFSPERFVDHNGTTTDEIAMNPTYFVLSTPKEIMQTLVHEMTHLWQFHFGKPGRGKYHNKEWASKMESIGLMPSSTGKPGGKRVGDCMGDYVIEGGLFDTVFCSLMTRQFQITWGDKYPSKDKIREATENGTLDELQEELQEWGISLDEVTTSDEPKKKTRVRFTCPSCLSNAWGKPSLRIMCEGCGVSFEESESYA